jgi:hypothetical protein
VHEEVQDNDDPLLNATEVRLGKSTDVLGYSRRMSFPRAGCSTRWQ